MVTFASVLLWVSLGADGACTPLQEAARVNDVPRIRQLLAGRLLGLAHAPGVEQLDQVGGGGGECAYRTPLMLAAQEGHREALEELVARGADPSLVAIDPELGATTAWCLAVMNGHQASASTVLSLQRRPAVCLDDAELIFAAREGLDAELRYRLLASPSQRALVYALNASIGRREVDQERPELLKRINDLKDLEAAKLAVRLGDTVSLHQLSEAGARSSNQSLFPLLSPNDTDKERAAMLRALDGLTRPSTGQLSYMAWDALSRDRLETLEALSEFGVSLGAQSAQEWTPPDDAALTVALSSRNPVRAAKALLALGVPLPSAAAELRCRGSR